MNREKWQILAREAVFDHPDLQVAMEKVSLPDGQVIADWPIVHARDYVNAVVFDEEGQVLILEGYQHGARRCSWQMIGSYLEAHENPLAVIERELLDTAGYQSDEWRYLGGFVVDANRYVGIAHFFLALDARRVRETEGTDEVDPCLRWVTPDDLRYALYDGRINVVNYAMNVMLGLMALNKLGRQHGLSFVQPKNQNSQNNNAC